MSLKPKKVDFNSTWSQIRSTLDGVITLSYVPRIVWNDRFTDVYNLCIAFPEPYGERLYQETKVFLDNHVKHLYENVRSHGEENLLSLYYNCWQEYSRGTSFLNKLYMYLNTQYIKKHKYSDADIDYGNLSIELQEQLLEIGELGLDLWKKNMIEPLETSLVALLLDGVNSDRCGDTPNYNVIHGVIQSFVSVEEYKKKHPMELYEKIFEKPFLRATGDFYRSAAGQLLQECDCSQYMEKVIQKLDEENLRCRKFIHPSSYSKVMQECEERMVADYFQVLHSECVTMVQQERKKDLRNAYTLLKPIASGLQELVKEVQKHMKVKGMEAVTNLKGDNIPAQFVENMLQVHSAFSRLIAEVFHGDQQFVGALDKACSSVINNRPAPRQPCRSPELLAKYCDSLLKKSAKGSSESEIDDKLAKSITVFKYIDDKDVFQKFYSKTLAKRLIYGQSMSMDAEEAMIDRLKQACGYEFTNKLHRMFTDISVSSDLNNKFSTYLKDKNEVLGINFSIYVLQACAWPLGQSNLTQFAIPLELERSVQRFEAFYNNRFCGRKLTWIHHLCTAELKLCYLKKPYLVTMGTFQMAILLLFESAISVTFKEIQEGTLLCSDHLNRNLQSLLDTKILLLKNQNDSTCPLAGSSSDAAVETSASSDAHVPSTGIATASPPSPLSSSTISVMGTALTEDTCFSLNLDFTNKRTKFKITTVIQKETPQEVEQTRTSVDEDRKLYVQAAIVRIMKARKVIRHNTLIEEVINQSRARFAPSIPMIKKCIEALIDKQYLERTPSSTDEYSYVA